MVGKVKRRRGGSRPGSGRKPKPAAERQRNRVMFTLTDAELEALVKASRGEAFSAFVRQIVLRYLSRSRS